MTRKKQNDYKSVIQHAFIDPIKKDICQGAS